PGGDGRRPHRLPRRQGERALVGHRRPADRVLGVGRSPRALRKGELGPRRGGRPARRARRRPLGQLGRRTGYGLARLSMRALSPQLPSKTYSVGVANAGRRLIVWRGANGSVTVRRHGCMTTFSDDGRWFW